MGVKVISLKKQIIITFGLIILVTIGVQTAVATRLNKQQTSQMVETQLQESVRNTVEQISVMRALVDSRKFEGKLSYYLKTQRYDYAQMGYDLNQFLINTDGKNKPYGNLQQFPIDERTIQELIKKQRGIVHVNLGKESYIVGFEFSNELKAILALVMNESDYYKTVHQITNVIVITGLLAFLVSCLASWLIVSGLTTPIYRMVDAVKPLEAGDLEANIQIPRFSGVIELSILGSSLQRAINSLHRFIAEIKITSEDLNYFSKELAQQNREIDQEAGNMVREVKEIQCEVEEQIKSVGKTQAVSTQLSELVSSVAEQNQASVDSGKRILELSAYGKNALDEVQVKMTGIKLAATDNLKAFDFLRQQLQLLDSINVSIKDIVQETRILAVNAAIESARAGQYGRSFRVVADEIGLLAEQAQGFSEKITGELSALVSEFNKIGASFGQTCQAINSCSQLVIDSSQLFSTIVKETDEHTAYVLAIADASGTMVKLILELTKEMDIISADSQTIAGRIPSMMDSVLHQKKNTSLTIDQTSNLGQMADKLQTLLDFSSNGAPVS